MSPILGIWASQISGHLYTPVGSYDALATVTVPSGGAATIDFAGIPTGYRHLQLRMLTRNTGAFNSFDPTYIRFNGDSGTTYSAHYMAGNGGGGTPGAGSATSTNQMWAGLTNYGNTTANVFSTQIIDILDYANTSKNKTIRVLSGVDCNGSGEVWYASGLWQSTSAVTSISVIARAAGVFSQYSNVALYGIK